MDIWMPKLVELVPTAITLMMLFAALCVAGTVGLLLWRATQVRAEERKS